MQFFSIVRLDESPANSPTNQCGDLFVDPCIPVPQAPNPDYPFYYTSKQIETGEIAPPAGSPFDVKFFDGPARRAIPDFSNNFEAELTLVGTHEFGVYKELATITYGFKITGVPGNPTYEVIPITVVQPSGFQLKLINHAKLKSPIVKTLGLKLSQ